MELSRCFWKVYCKKSAVKLISILFRSRESYLCVKDTGLGVGTISVDCRRPRGKICKYVKTMIRKAIDNFFVLLFITFAFQFLYLHENHYLIYYEEYLGKMKVYCFFLVCVDFSEEWKVTELKKTRSLPPAKTICQQNRKW